MSKGEVVVLGVNGHIGHAVAEAFATTTSVEKTAVSTTTGSVILSLPPSDATVTGATKEPSEFALSLTTPQSRQGWVGMVIEMQESRGS